MEEHSRGYTQVREDIQQLRQHVIHLDRKVDRFREELSGRIDALDQKVGRFREECAGRIDALEGRLSARIDVLDQKFCRWFSWVTSILVTALLAQMGLLGAALFAR